MSRHRTRRDGRPYWRAIDLIAEVEFLLTDRSPHDIARCLGYTSPGCVARAMYRAGRADLARPFNTAAMQQRTV